VINSYHQRSPTLWPVTPSLESLGFEGLGLGGSTETTTLTACQAVTCRCAPRQSVHRSWPWAAHWAAEARPLSSAVGIARSLAVSCRAAKEQQNQHQQQLLLAVCTWSAIRLHTLASTIGLTSTRSLSGDICRSRGAQTCTLVHTALASFAVTMHTGPIRALAKSRDCRSAVNAARAGSNRLRGRPMFPAR
jgi:hypothetical protein